MEIFYVSALVILLIVLVLYTFNKEGFGDKNERAKIIVDKTKNVMVKPSYSSFKSAMGGDTDVVEYDAAKKAFHNGNYNIEKLKNYL